jgi:hypothetical protein
VSESQSYELALIRKNPYAMVLEMFDLQVAVDTGDFLRFNKIINARIARSLNIPHELLVDVNLTNYSR